MMMTNPILIIIKFRKFSLFISKFIFIEKLFLFDINIKFKFILYKYRMDLLDSEFN